MAGQPHLPYALPEGLRYYLLRGGVMIPLVPVDQLPFQLQGVPRQLNHRQISDQGWKYLTETDEVPSSIPIQAPTATFSPQSAAKSRFLAPDHHVRNDSHLTRAESSRTSRWPVATTESVPEPRRSTSVAASEPHSSLTDTFASIYQKDAQRIGYRMPYPSGIEPDPLKKEFCTHWIKTGECAFMSIGCKYKHEMPTIEKLRELGFTQGMPKWWKEKSAITARGQTWMQRRLAQGNEEEEVPAPRAFDPSTFRSRQADDRGLLDDGVQDPTGILRKEPVIKPTTTSRLAPAPVPVTCRPADPVSNLLIDLDETPVAPPSPQPSNSSSASDRSYDSHGASSHTSESPPLSPIIRSAFLPIAGSPIPTPDRKQGGTEPTIQPSVRRHSQISWSSESEEEPKPTKSYSRRPEKSSPRKPFRRSTAPSKPPGLANSKHAPSTSTKHADNHRRNTGRKTGQPKSNGVAAPELYAKIELLRREKERAWKSGTTNSSERHGRAVGASSDASHGKQTAK